ncbi:hypothetical protein DLM_0545 [Aquitalea magnusonii]|jgi:hypothetical protein|uniref:Uncharacterized protein n=1 Tax=Aquitalea magnusonii TaxID=332411 RepID=A0A3G9GFA0_9NEIS|nr:hypothetical protein [Aquitalea magnusonii]BBF84206.1 hypothetical protein DLM_0545 [Aquitalea magnusonii]
MDKAIKAAMEGLLRVATGETPHIRRANCPENGSADRQPDCPACQAIERAERLLQPQWADKSQLLETMIRRLDIG